MERDRDGDRERMERDGERDVNGERWRKRRRERWRERKK